MAGYTFCNIRDGGVFASRISTENFEWLTLTAMELKHVISISSDPKNQIGVGNTLATFTLLPLDWQINYGHSWSEVDSAAGKLSQLEGTIKNAAEKAAAFASSETTTAKGMIDALNKESYGKVDNALVYATSNKRAYQFSFEFADQGGTGGAYLDVVEPLKWLTELSLPSLEDSLLTFPSVWSMTLGRGDLIDVKWGVLENVSADFAHASYRDTYPTHAKVTIQYKEIIPPYRNANALGKGYSSNRSLISTGAMAKVDETLKRSEMMKDNKNIAISM